VIAMAAEMIGPACIEIDKQNSHDRGVLMLPVEERL
jgi:hypothetical protein